MTLDLIVHQMTLESKAMVGKYKHVNVINSNFNRNLSRLVLYLVKIGLIPENTKYLYNICTTVAVQMLYRCFVFSGMCIPIIGPLVL